MARYLLTCIFSDVLLLGIICSNYRHLVPPLKLSCIELRAPGIKNDELGEVGEENGTDIQYF